MSTNFDSGPRKVPAHRGMAWALGGWTLLQAQPGRLILIGLLMQVVVSAVRLPGVGLFVTLLLPALTAGMLLAFRRVGRGIRPPVGSLFEPLVPSRTLGRLLLLGAIILVVASMLIGILVAAPLQALDPSIVEGLERGDPSGLAELDPSQLMPLVLAVATGMALAGTLAYFAVPLIAFRGISTGASIWRGLRGLGRNWLPFLVFAVFVFATGFPVFTVAVWLLGLGSGAGFMGSLAVLVAMLVVLAWQVYLFGCQWVAFADVFPKMEPDSEPGGGQLVA